MCALAFSSRAYVHILCGMPERHCCLPLKGLLRPVNVTFPSPKHSVTHSLLIALLGVLMEKKDKDVVTVSRICLEG